jgi:hypothetical protein
VLPTGNALGENKSPKAPAATAVCAQGFNARGVGVDATGNYGCRSPVIGCPQREGYLALIMPEEILDTRSGLQFGYRCEYRRYPG